MSRRGLLVVRGDAAELRAELARGDVYVRLTSLPGGLTAVEFLAEPLQGVEALDDRARALADRVPFDAAFLLAGPPESGDEADADDEVGAEPVDTPELWVLALGEVGPGRPVVEVPLAAGAATALGLLAGPDRRSLLITSAAPDELRDAADWHRLVLEVGSVGQGWTAVRRLVEDDEKNHEDWCDAMIVSGMSRRSTRTVEFWHDAGMSGVAVWRGPRPVGSLVWGLHQEIVVPASEADHAGLPDATAGSDLAASRMAAALAESGYVVDAVSLRALGRRRELDPGDGTARAVAVLALPEPVRALVGEERDVDDLPGYECIVGRGKRELVSRWSAEPAPAGTPAVLRVGYTRPLWYRIACALVGVVMTVGFLVRVLGSDSTAVSRLLGVGQGLVALVCWYLAFAPTARSRSSA